MKTFQSKQHEFEIYSWAGLFTLSLRLVVGWTYFSAFWRRLVLENKLIPDAPGYIGEKFNHFLPNSLGIKPLIEYLVSNPDTLWWAMVIFTLIEGVVGLLFMLGFFTRLMSIGVISLAAGILLGSGWLGTTCLDEWQIGILGVAGGFSVFLSGGGRFSLDAWMLSRLAFVRNRRWVSFLTSGILPGKPRSLRSFTISGAFLILVLALFTNQAFHQGVWGPLHNKSVKPKIEISDAFLSPERLSFTVYRVEGADVYGSFLIGIHLRDADGRNVLELNGSDLAHFPVQEIRNQYIAKVQPGKYSLVIPLGAKAQLTLQEPLLKDLPKGKYALILTDISGAEWSTTVENF